MKKPIILLFLLVVLAVAAVLIGPGLVDWDQYKDQVTARIGTVTGLRVAIDGEMDLALLPRPTFKASGVRIAGLSTAITPDMASVDALEVQVALMPLLGGDIQVQRVALLKPFLMLESLPEGGSNWSSGPGAAVPSSVRLERVNIQDGVLVWRDGRNGREERIEDIDISLSASSLSGPMQMVGNATVREVPLTLDLSTSRVTGAGALPMGLTLGLQDAGGTLRLAGIASLKNGFQGEVSGEAGSLHAVLRQIWPDSPLPPSADQPVVFEAALRTMDGAVELTGLTADFGDSTATGAIKATLSDIPHVDLALSINRIDLDDWIPKAGPSGGAEAGTLLSLGNLTAAGLGLPADLSATVDLAVDAMTLRGALVRQARLEGFLNDGIVSISRLTAQLPGGSDITLAGTVRSDQGVPYFDFDAQAAASDLRGALEWMGLSIPDVPSARLRRFSGSATISGRPDEFQIGGFDFVIDGTRASGGLAYVNRGRPGIGLRLEASRLNLDAYRPPGAVAVLDSDAMGWLVDLLGSADANLDVTMAGITVDGVAMRNIRLDATVNGGAVTFREAMIGDAAGASVSLNGSIGALAPLSGADLAFTFAATDLARLRRTFGLGGQSSADNLDTLTASGRVTGDADTLAIEILAGLAGGTLEIGGNVLQPWRSPTYDLAMRARHPDLEALLALWMPDYRPTGPLGPLDLFGEVSGTQGALAVNSLQGTVGAVTLAGHCRFVSGADRPFVEAVLRTSELTLDPWVARASRAGARSSRRWSNEALDFSVLSEFDGTLALTATGLEAGALHLTDPALEAQLTEGAVDLTGLSGRLFGGTLGASGRFDTGEGRPTVQLSLNLVGADLAEALQATVGISEFSGLLDFGLEADTVGGSIAELVGNLNGGGLFAARDGQVLGIDLAETAAGLDSLTDPLEFLDLQQQTLTAGSTGFAALNATFQVTDGVATTDDVRLVGQDGVATGRGVFDLSRWQIDLTTDFDLTGMPEAPTFGVRLIGPPHDPERVLQTADLQAFIARRAADAVSRRYDQNRPRPTPEDQLAPTPAPQTN